MSKRQVAVPKPPSEPMRGATGRGAHSGHEGLARALGVFSIGLGLAELLAPKAFCTAFGMKDRETLFRAYGARELATGVAIMMTHDPTPWIWGRVGGDALDLATLAMASRDADEEQTRNVTIAAAAVAGVTVLDAVCAAGLTADKRLSHPGTFDYADRSGFPKTPNAMRGAASDLDMPADFRVPDPLRPWVDGVGERDGDRVGA